MNSEAQAPGKLISVVIPVFNEQDNIETAYAAIKELFEPLSPRYRFEIIFTDNHSSDGSFAIIERLATADSRVRGVRFVRNFGFHRSVLTGLRLATGDAAVQIDCDLQDPPATIADFIEGWELGHDVVVGVRRTREDGQSHLLARRIFYSVLTRISHDSIVPDSGDFRLLDRTILDQLRDIHETSPYLRGLTSSLAARQYAVLYDRQMRRRGKSKFPLSRLVGLALDAIFAHSTVPLRLATYAGLVIAFVTFLLSAAYALGRMFFSLDWPAGFATTTVLLLLGISLNAIFLGIIGEYIGRIYNQVRFRPTTVIERSINLGEPPRLGATQLYPYPMSPSPFGNIR